MEEFVKKFAELFDDTDKSVFTSQTKFKELDEWSSLTALALISMIDEEYDVTIKGDDIRDSASIEDLYNIIKFKI